MVLVVVRGCDNGGGAGVEVRTGEVLNSSDALGEERRSLVTS